MACVAPRRPWAEKLPQRPAETDTQHAQYSNCRNDAADRHWAAFPAYQGIVTNKMFKLLWTSRVSAFTRAEVRVPQFEASGTATATCAVREAAPLAPCDARNTNLAAIQVAPTARTSSSRWSNNRAAARASDKGQFAHTAACLRSRETGAPTGPPRSTIGLRGGILGGFASSALTSQYSVARDDARHMAVASIATTNFVRQSVVTIGVRRATTVVAHRTWPSG